MAFAQEATLTGTRTNATGGVLPGVTVTAVNGATAKTFTAVTDALSIYRIPVRVGACRLTTELSGSTTVTQMAVQVLVVPTASINAQPSSSTVRQTSHVIANRAVNEAKVGQFANPP
jgi:hypothetical protein